jgi:hypothetical protein
MKKDQKITLLNDPYVLVKKHDNHYDVVKNEKCLQENVELHEAIEFLMKHGEETETYCECLYPGHRSKPITIAQLKKTL